MLQQGYRVEYCAASDAMTHAPERFKEFFNQRRRWIPSTLANIMDLLGSYRTTVKINDNISYLYMAYQGALMLSTILGPATVLLMMAGAFNAVIKTSLWQSYLLAVGPSVLYLILCFILKPDIQLTVAAILSAIYSLLMMAVVVGTMVQVAEDTVVSPNAIFLLMLLAIFIISACFHPQEFLCLIPGALYFLCIPSGYVLLILYAMCNMHVVSWGTREMAGKSQAEIAKHELMNKNQSGIMSWLGKKDDVDSCCGISGFFRRFCGTNGKDANAEILRQVMEKLDKVEAGVKSVSSGASTAQHHRRRSSSRSRRSHRSNIEDIEEEDDVGDESDMSTTTEDDDHIPDEERDDLINPKWIEDPGLRNGEIIYMSAREIDFWEKCITKYLYPIAPDKAHESKVAADLKSMRNNVAFAFFMMNAFWMIIIFMLQSVKDKVSIPIPRPGRDPLPIEPLGLVFLIFFAFILIMQFAAMLRHRYGTLLHILASTDLRCCRKRYDPKKHIREAVEYARVLQRLHGFDDDPDPDYDYLQGSESKSNLHRNNLCSSNEDIHSNGILHMFDGGDVNTAVESQFPPMFDMENPGFRGSFHGVPDELPTEREIQTVASRPRHRSRSHAVDKNNTLRRAFVRRYTKLIRQQSSEVANESNLNTFLNGRADTGSVRHNAHPEPAEELVSKFNKLNR